MSNTIALAKRLEREHGFNQPQAEGIAQAIHEHESEHVATKADLADLKTELKADIATLETKLADLKTELKADIATLETKLETGLTQLQVRLMTWTTALAGIIIAVLKLT